MDEPVVVVGWDVGGWLGSKNAMAVATWDVDGSITWAGVGSNRLPVQPGPLPDLVEALAGQRAASVVRDALERDLRLVVAVDAPLGVPDAFREFLADPNFIVTRPARHIDHPLSFRETDRQIAALTGKVPLSATFDSLANPASVAVAFTRRWTQHGFRLVTANNDAPRRAIIEVYPALSKQAFAVLGARSTRTSRPCCLPVRRPGRTSTTRRCAHSWRSGSRAVRRCLA